MAKYLVNRDCARQAHDNVVCDVEQNTAIPDEDRNEKTIGTGGYIGVFLIFVGALLLYVPGLFGSYSLAYLNDLVNSPLGMLAIAMNEDAAKGAQFISNMVHCIYLMMILGGLMFARGLWNSRGRS